MGAWQFCKDNWRQLMLASFGVAWTLLILSRDDTVRYFADYSPWFPEQKANPQVLTWKGHPILDIDSELTPAGSASYPPARFDGWWDKWQTRVLMGTAQYAVFSEMATAGTQLARPLDVEMCHEGIVDQMYLEPFLRDGTVFAYVLVSHYNWDLTAIPASAYSLDKKFGNGDDWNILGGTEFLSRPRALRILDHHPTLIGHVQHLQRAYLKAQVGASPLTRQRLSNLVWRIETDQGLVLMDALGKLYRPYRNRDGFYEYYIRRNGRVREIKAQCYSHRNKLPNEGILLVEPL